MVVLTSFNTKFCLRNEVIFYTRVHISNNDADMMINSKELKMLYNKNISMSMVYVKYYSHNLS